MPTRPKRPPEPPASFVAAVARALAESRAAGNVIPPRPRDKRKRFLVRFEWLSRAQVERRLYRFPPSAFLEHAKRLMTKLPVGVGYENARGDRRGSRLGARSNEAESRLLLNPALDRDLPMWVRLAELWARADLAEDGVEPERRRPRDCAAEVLERWGVWAGPAAPHRNTLTAYRRRACANAASLDYGILKGLLSDDSPWVVLPLPSRKKASTRRARRNPRKH